MFATIADSANWPWAPRLGPQPSLPTANTTQTMLIRAKLLRPTLGMPTLLRPTLLTVDAHCYTQVYANGHSYVHTHVYTQVCAQAAGWPTVRRHDQCGFGLRRDHSHTSCIDMRMGMGLWMCVWVHGHMSVDMCMCMCTDMYIDMCTPDMCVQLRRFPPRKKSAVRAQTCTTFNIVCARAYDHDLGRWCHDLRRWRHDLGRWRHDLRRWRHDP